MTKKVIQKFDKESDNKKNRFMALERKEIGIIQKNYYRWDA